MIRLNFIMKILTLFVCLLGGFTGYLISICSLYFYNKSLKLNKLTFFFITIWFMPFISTVYVNKAPLKIGGFMKTIDQG